MTEVTNLNQTFAQIPTTLLRHPGVSANAKLLYCILWDYADRNTRHAHPSRKTLAGDLGRSLDTLDRAIKELESVNAIIVNQRFTQDGDRTSNGYRLTPFTSIHPWVDPSVDPSVNSEEQAEGSRMGAATWPQEKERNHRDPAGQVINDQNAPDEWAQQEPRDPLIVRDDASASSLKSTASSGRTHWMKKEKAKRNGPKFTHSETKPPSRKQLTFIRDALIMHGEDEPDKYIAALNIASSAEADEYIKEYWQGIEHMGRDEAILHLDELSPQGKAFALRNAAENWR